MLKFKNHVFVLQIILVLLLACFNSNLYGVHMLPRYIYKNGQVVDNDAYEWCEDDGKRYLDGNIRSSQLKIAKSISNGTNLRCLNRATFPGDPAYWRDVYARYDGTSVYIGAYEGVQDPETAIPVPEQITNTEVNKNVTQIGITQTSKNRWKLLDLKDFEKLEKIGAGTFEALKDENGKYVVNDITNLTIPEKCNWIGPKAFRGNVSLEKVNITCKGLNHIENDSFEDCDNIEEFSFSMSESQSDFVNNLKQGTEGTLGDNSVESFAKYYHNKGYTVSCEDTGDDHTLYIRKTPLKMKNLGGTKSSAVNSNILSAEECSLDLSDFGVNQHNPNDDDYESYIRVRLLEDKNPHNFSNWAKSNNGCPIKPSKPGIYEMEGVALSKNYPFKSQLNGLKIEDNHLKYEDENGDIVDLGEIENNW